MINEDRLRDTLATVFEHLKSHHDDLIMLYGQVVAMRRAFDELSGGKFLPLLDKYVVEAEAQTNDALSRLAAEFDETIQKVRMGGSF
jgi:hypothetical protein